MYAEVAVNSPVARPRTFSYAIPQGLLIEPGQAVWAPFGSRLVQGIVFDVSDTPAFPDTRDIDRAIGTSPLLSKHQVELARWIGDYYLSPYFDTANLMLPPGFERKLLTYISINPDLPQSIFDSLSPEQKEIVKLIREKDSIELGQLKKMFGGKIESTINQLAGNKVLIKTQEIAKPKVKPKLERYLKLASKIDPDLLSRTPKQAELLALLAPNGDTLPLSQINKQFTSGVIKALINKGFASIENVRVQRDPLAGYAFQTAMPPVLTQAQDDIWQDVKTSIEDQKGKVFLLHGVTGSGKTEIYLRALEETVARGKRGIVLVPEISLTPQTINRFASRFPDRVAVLHSKLSLGERYDEWHRIKEGMFDVVIGSRGAIFAPQPDLGLIVIDEEHEWTYKQQEQSPRYHAKDVAVKLSELTGATVIMGSATPDVTDYFGAKNNEYHLLELPERIAKESKKELPRVELVDMRTELKTGNRSIFSRPLAQAISEALKAKEQVILFLNKRGSASFVQCRDCGHVIGCRRCQSALTYHSAEQGLICHQCNYRIATPKICPSCGSQRIKFLGIGTQKVAEEVSKSFKSARILRWDRDVTKSKNSHEQIMNSFLNHEADILIGTQMIAKGLDMPKVTLVGVISADVALHLPDFRSGERTFQILTQVAGRAGRDIEQGKVVIQTYTPDHYAIAAAAQQDYSVFYAKEIKYRRQLNNPPFSRLALLRFSHSNAEYCYQEAKRMFKTLDDEIRASGIANTMLIGPSPSFIEKLRGRYRWQIIIRTPDPTELLSSITLPQRWAVNIDPVSLL